MKVYSLVMVFLFTMHTTSIAQTIKYDTTKAEGSIEIYGRVTDQKGNGLEFARITLFEGEIEKGFAKTGLDGNYRITQIQKCKCELNLKVYYVGYQERIINILGSKENVHVDIRLETRKRSANNRMGLHSSYSPIRIDRTEPNRKIITKEQIKHFPW